MAACVMNRNGLPCSAALSNGAVAACQRRYAVALGQRKDVGPAIGQRLQLAAIGELDRQQIDEGRASSPCARLQLFF